MPHYLGQTEFGDAALMALERVRAATGLDLDTQALAATAGLNRAEITRQMEESDEITAVVHALEQQYDTFLEGRKQRNLLATDLSDLPTADEIGAEFEAFLKDVTDEVARRPVGRAAGAPSTTLPTAGRVMESRLGLAPAADDRRCRRRNAPGRCPPRRARPPSVPARPTAAAAAA